MSSPPVTSRPGEPDTVEPGDNASARQLRETRYLLIESFLDDPLRTVAYHYAHRRARLGHGAVDSQVPGTPSFYGDILMDSLLEVATASVEDITGRQLAPTYSYFRIYKHGDILAPHRDRPACEISLTICLGLNPGAAGSDYVWPLHVRRDDQRDGVAIPCRPGDAIVYHGCEVWHWRDAFAGENQAQVFLHYVDRHGPHAHLEFDGRPELALPSARGQDGRDESISSRPG